MEVDLSDTARKQLTKLPSRELPKIEKKLKALPHTPLAGKKLTGHIGFCTESLVKNLPS